MNVLKDIPYCDENMGRRKIVDQKEVLIMQIALKPGQVVPEHNANSNVHLLILKGSVVLTVDGTSKRLQEGDIQPVQYQALMSIKNDGTENSTFLVIKTPNPNQIQN
ncbi:MAG TPA: hypothetical protein PLP64_09035 [Pseudothermotoga sp.]|nr:hypothetical protein [Pseudothermotoga sp.]HOK84352.1 hypothetical protein [Pseudothermotoga sp.]HPP70764.1 hypothetical protein [Pseudothermotoga sp.]